MFETAIQPDLASLLGAIDLSVVRVNQAWVLTTMRKDGPALVRLLWRMLGREEDVLDAYQDSFCKLIAYSEKSGERPERAFVFRVAINAARDIGRKRRVRLAHFPTVAEEMRRRDEEKSEAAPGGGLLVEELRSAIETLPERLRDVISLRDLAELSYRDVARILNITVGTARVYRREAIVALSERMRVREEGANEATA
ncbi:MAG TPA: sigma-70 family RNA polymerase sigma factor [Phycisphaerae bacterium]|nr:sigma-70 family RNA polymerase sigma factor [Phycisphaerae bacterium]HRW53700.1 sigma-70 family RNA polymerase sigma factor [Phycisphaerae bacterium]